MSENILVIDTASGAGAVGLVAGGRLQGQRRFPEARRQAECLFPAAKSLLEDSSLTLANLNAIAVATGPGAFTSLRVGITAAKSLGEALGLPLIGISTLAAVARLAPGYPAAILLPASRAELFSATATCLPLATDSRGHEAILSAAEVGSMENWIANFCGSTRYVLSTHQELLDTIVGRLPAEVRLVLVPANPMEQLAAISRERCQDARFDDPLVLDATYVRRDDADRSWTDSRIG